MKAEYRLDHMREGPVSDVMQQRRNSDCRLRMLRDVVREAQLRNEPLREVKRAQAVSKPRMLRRLISKIRQPKLAYPPQPLKLRRIDQPNNKPPLIRVRIDTNDVVHR